MPFPEISHYPESHPGPYERQMGRMILDSLRFFAGHVVDSESNSCMTKLAQNPSRWSAAHAVFDELRCRLPATSGTEQKLRKCQYYFEESCSKALYNASMPLDPFDSGSAFFVVPQALMFAEVLGLAVEDVVDALSE